MIHKFIIKGSYFSENKTFPLLNDYLNMGFRERAKAKRDYQTIAVNAIRLQLKRLEIKNAVNIHFHYFEPDEKRDLDNVAGTSHKIIIDALVKCKVIIDDRQLYVKGMSDQIFVDRKNPRIEVFIEEILSK